MSGVKVTIVFGGGIVSQRVSHSFLDPILGPLFQSVYPLLRIPRWFPPEGIVVLGHLSAALGAVGLAYGLRSPWFAFLGLAGIAGNHFADCIDGTHARRTGQCRHGGELLDHFTDPLSFAYWLVGIGVAINRLDWALAAIIILFAHAVLTNIKAKLTDRFVLSAFGPTEFKTLLCLVAGSLFLAQLCDCVPRGILDQSLAYFYEGLIVVGACLLIVNLVRSVREVNRSCVPIDSSEWITRSRD